MSEAAEKGATYQELYKIPEHMTGEIIDGELLVTPRPSRQHAYAASALGNDIGPAYQFGRGGPGGWVILFEPEIKLGLDTVVPDLAGWKRGRFPVTEDFNWISVTPDWVCEILSPATLRTDKIKKLPLYGRHAVPFCWLLDPIAQTLDVFRLESGRWVVAGLYGGDEKVRAEPFEEIEIDLNDLWLTASPG